MINQDSSEQNIFVTRMVYGLIIFSAIGLLFTAADILFRITNVGENLHYKIWSPNLIIESNPTRADIKLLDEENNILASQTTPLKIRDLPPGNYQLDLYKPNWGETSREITVTQPREGKKEFNIPDSNIIGGSHIISFKGLLTVNSYPSKADIYIDEEYIGKTPHTKLLDIGTYDIRLHRDGFQDIGDSKSNRGLCLIDLTARVDQQNNFDENFWAITKRKREKTEPKHYILTGLFRKNYTINSNPSGAEIYVNNFLKPVGYTPMNLLLLAGEHRVKISKPGYQNWTNTINIHGNSPDTLSVNLDQDLSINVYRGTPGTGKAGPSLSDMDRMEGSGDFGEINEDISGQIKDLMENMPALPF